MTITFCYEYKLLKPSTTANKVPVDFELDNFMLRGAMTIFQVFMPTFTKHFKRLFYYQFSKKVGQKPLWRRVDQIFLQHCMPIC